MKRIVTLGNTPASLDPRNLFGTAWVAAFLGVVLIVSAVFWVASAL